jgi:DegV family protein with EDD domain
VALRIVTDSSADLPARLAQELGITILPCYVTVGDTTYRDGVDLSPDDFYRDLVSTARLPTTAQPSVADFQAVYREMLDQGDEVISIHVSGKLSGTLNSASQARAALGDVANERIHIIDSQLASICLGLVALEAAHLAREGVSTAQVLDQVNQCLPSTHGLFVLDTLEYLEKGGRIGKARAYLGSLLSVKPILRLQDGEAHPVERPRSRERAVRRVVEMVHELAPIRRLAVIHNTTPEELDDLREKLSGLAPAEDIISSRFGPTLGTYMGPRALGVGLITE